MNEAVRKMLERYDTGTVDAAVQALREILQETALLGLWRARFFEHAAFYGGTALRIVHGLDRFSEDLDFTLLEPRSGFTVAAYLDALKEELAALGFEVAAEAKEKTRQSAIQSAFLKADTRQHLISIEAPPQLVDSIAPGRLIRIRLEIDTQPPGGFETEARFLFQPIPFSVRVCALPDLFAGKMHAVLCREWKSRVKGRDWYDFVWFAANHPALHLAHLEARMRQSGHLKSVDPLDEKAFRDLLHARIERLSISAVRSEVLPFLRDTENVALWSREFFHAAAEKVTFV